jgi:KDO2-lipid IV(A) lauroyltransferase
MCMLADHRDLNGRVVPFFGYPAPSATLPALMSVKLDLPIYAARVDRLDGVRFSVHIEKITAIRTQDQEDDVTRMTAAIQATFERWIRERPDQWVWFYNRWEAPPNASSPPPASTTAD